MKIANNMSKMIYRSTSDEVRNFLFDVAWEKGRDTRIFQESEMMGQICLDFELFLSEIISPSCQY